MDCIIKFVGLLLIFPERFTFGEDVSAVDQVITATNGTITSPSYPGPYGSNMTFTWRFEAPVGKVVELKFDELDLETDITDSRCIDTIEVIDGSVRSNLLSVEPICSKDLGWPRYPTQFLSSSNFLTVIMQTNNRLSGRGFRATYRHVEPRSEYIAAIGVNYGRRDGNGITPDEGVAMILKFHRFQARFLPPIVIPESTQPSALTYDPITDFFYYTDIGGKFIGRIHADGEQSDILIRDDIENPLGIAVASLTGLLFWTDEGRDEVSVSRLNGLDRKTIVTADPGCVSPRGIALTLDQEYVFWSCSGRIERSKTDGSGREVFVDEINGVRSLFIHPQDKKLYWMNTAGPIGIVERINLDGSNRSLLLQEEQISEFHDFVMDQSLFFWSDHKTGRLYHKTQNSSLGVVYHRTESIKIKGLYYVSSDAAQREDVDGCVNFNNGSCTKVCFPGGHSINCRKEDVDGCVNFNNGSCTKVCFPGGHSINCRKGYRNTSVSIRFPLHYVILGAAIVVIIALVVVFVGRSKFQSQPDPTRANQPI